MPTFYCNYFFGLALGGPIHSGAPWTLPTLPTPLLRHWIGCTTCCTTSWPANPHDKSKVHSKCTTSKSVENRRLTINPQHP